MPEIHIPLGPYQPQQSCSVRQIIQERGGKNKTIQAVLLSQNDDVLQKIDDVLSQVGEGILYLLDKDDISEVVEAANRCIEESTAANKKVLLVAAGL